MRFLTTTLCLTTLLQACIEATANFDILQSAAAAAGVYMNEDQVGKYFVFKEIWAPNPNIPSDSGTGVSHVRLVLVQITRSGNELDCQGSEHEAQTFRAPTEEDGDCPPVQPGDLTNLDPNGRPINAVLVMRYDDGEWNANKRWSAEQNQWVSISRPNTYEFIAADVMVTSSAIEDVFSTTLMADDVWVLGHNDCQTVVDRVSANLQF